MQYFFEKNRISWKSLFKKLKIEGQQFKQFQVLICLFLGNLGFQLMEPTKATMQKKIKNKKYCGEINMYLSVFAEKRKQLGSHQISPNLVFSKRYVNVQYLVGSPFVLITASVHRGVDTISL